jgi:hypothetical protein
LLKILGDVPNSRCTIGINDTGGKFAPNVNYTGRKFATGIKDTGGKSIFPTVSLVLLITAANLLPVLATLVANCHRYQRHQQHAQGAPPVSLTPVANGKNH